MLQFMTKHIVFFIALLFSVYAQAQKIKISESTEEVEKITRTGMSTAIELDAKDVQKAWQKQLKNYGKLDVSNGVITVPVANVSAISSSPCRIVSTVKSNSKGATVWWAIDMGDAHVTASGNNSAYRSAERILHDFAAECYRDDINEQVKDAEKALNASVKAHDKEVREGENLVKDVAKNKQDKANLEQKLKDNAAELEQLQKDIAKNKTDQATAVQETEKMKKAVEVVRAKLNGIE